MGPIILAILFIIIFWVSESLLDAYFFHQADFVTSLFSPDDNELWMRCLIIIFTFSIAIYSQSFIARIKKTDEKLRHKELILEKAQEISEIGSWDLNLRDNTLQWSDEIFRIFGLSPNEFKADYETFLNTIHPDDKAKVKSAVESAMQTGKAYLIEHRILLPDGKVREVLEQGEVYFGEDKKPVRMIGTVQDITEQKKITARLSLSSLVFEHSLEGIFITDKDGNFQLVNQTFCEITGYSEHEVLGKNASLLNSGKHDKQFFAEMFKSLENTGKWQGEVWNRRKNGEEYLQWHSITTVKQHESGTTQYLNFFTDITEKNEIRSKLVHQSFHDALTGLANRSLFQDRLTKTIQHAERNSRILTIMFLGLDRFKNINDSLGHAVGDELLKAVSLRLDEIVPDDATIARMSGDEFGLLLPNIEHEDDATVMANVIMDLFRPPFIIDEHEIYITSSIGIGSYPIDGDKAENLIKNTNTAMSRAKEQGKNNFQLYNPVMNIRAAELVAMERNLRKALLRDEICVHYQPKVDIQSGRMTGMEALVRWQRPDIGMISPADFIPLAEDTGIITLIGEWVLRDACRQTKEWRDKGYKDLVVSVNLSGVQFLQQDLIATVRSSLRETRLPATSLELEITESILMNNVDEAIAIMQNFSTRGIKLSIDDFGTGYSSLSYLRRFPIDTLKIDKAFVNEITTNKEDSAIASIVISLGKCLNLKVIAEGVETLEQLELLKEQGCNEIQGYYFSRPLPAKDFEKLLEANKNLWG